MTTARRSAFFPSRSARLIALAVGAVLLVAGCGSSDAGVASSTVGSRAG